MLDARIVDIAEGGIDAAAALDFVSDPRFGGLACFVGKVRAQNLGRVVTGISYQVHAALACNLFRGFAERAVQAVDCELKLSIVHATGRLAVGDVAVVVAAGTPHRDEAFRACRMVIEAVKHEAPIWKREHYEDGDSAWSEGCSLCETSREHDAGHARGQHHGHGHG
ncbi:molybdenum cofactor biosynthesis protein MoaE [Oleiagrimonas sp. C23AA]|nr:molybdenum cofactor biosynthesis protein MoaE [Oleiagrimonas sp. C23AA]